MSRRRVIICFSPTREIGRGECTRWRCVWCRRAAYILHTKLLRNRGAGVFSPDRQSVELIAKSFGLGRVERGWVDYQSFCSFSSFGLFESASAIGSPV